MRGLSKLRGLSALSGASLGNFLESTVRGLTTATDLKSALKEKIPEQQVGELSCPDQCVSRCMRNRLCDRS